MDKAKLTEKMEDVVRSYRERLANDEDSFMANIGNFTKLGLESIKASFSGSDEAKHSLENFKMYSDNFAKALKNKDKRLAGMALDQMENEIQSIKTKTV